MLEKEYIVERKEAPTEYFVYDTIFDEAQEYYKTNSEKRQIKTNPDKDLEEFLTKLRILKKAKEEKRIHFKQLPSSVEMALAELKLEQYFLQDDLKDLWIKVKL